MKIIVNEFNGHSVIDVQLQNGAEIIYSKQGLNQDTAETTILMLAESYNLSTDTEIINTVFLNNEKVEYKITWTLSDFMEEE